MKSILNLITAFAARHSVCMAEFGPQDRVARVAAADLSGKQYVIVASNGTAEQCVAATDPTSSLLLGVLQTNPKSGENASIAYQGRSKVQCGGGVIAVDTYVTTNTSGRAAAVLSGQVIVGRLVEAAAAEGDLCTIMLQPPIRWNGAA